MPSESLSSPQQPLPTEQDLSPFVHKTPMAVAYELRQLVQNAVSVAVYFNHGKDMMLTRLLQVDSKAQTFVFDLAGHAPTNDALLCADKILFVAAPEGVKTQFSVSSARLCQFEGSPAFVAGFPLDLIKLQRREFFRLTTPVSNAYLCKLALGNTPPGVMEMHDISLGGFGAWVPQNWVAQLETGQIHESVWFELGSLGEVKISFEVRSLREVMQASGPRWLLGAKFINLSRALEAGLQRLIIQLERERKALLD